MNPFAAVGTIAIAVVLVVPALAIHEGWHVLSALLCGFSIETVTLGPLRLRWSKGRCSVTRVALMVGGLAHVVPAVQRDRRSTGRLCLYLALPPALTVAGGLLSLLWSSAHQGPAATLVGSLGGAQLLVGFITLFPWMLELRKSDGQRLMALLRPGSARRRERALFVIQHDAVATRPRAMDPELIADATTDNGRYAEHEGCLRGYFFALDSDDVPSAEVMLSRIESSPVKPVTTVALQVQIERAYLAAFHARDRAATTAALAVLRATRGFSQRWFTAAVSERTGFGLRAAAAALYSVGQLAAEFEREVRRLIEQYGPTFSTETAVQMPAADRLAFDTVLAAAAAQLAAEPALGTAADLATSLLRSSAHGEFAAADDEQARVQMLIDAGFRVEPTSHRLWQTGYGARLGGWIVIVCGLMVFRIAAGGWAVTRAGSRYNPVLPLDAIQRAHILFGFAAAAGLTISVLALWILYLYLGRGFVRLTLLLFLAAAIAATAAQSIVDPARIGFPAIGWFYTIAGLLSLPLFKHAWNRSPRNLHDPRAALPEPPLRSLERVMLAGGLPLVLALLVVAQTRLQFSSYFSEGGASSVSAAQDLKNQPGPLHATYVFDDGITDAGRQLVTDSVLRADRYLRQTLGASVAQPIVVNVHAANSGAAPYDGAADGHTIAVNAPSKNGDPVATPGMEASVVRQLFRVMVSELSGDQASVRGAGWLATGGAELVARQALIDDGYFSADASRACLLKALHPESATLPALSILAQRRNSDGSGADVTALETLAVSSATAHTGLASLPTYFSRVATMDGAVAFQTTFGLSLGDFYRQFSGERASFRSPAGATCAPANG